MTSHISISLDVPGGTMHRRGFFILEDYLRGMAGSMVPDIHVDLAAKNKRWLKPE